MKYKHILLFDFETSGLNPFEEQIIEIGALLLTKVDGEYKEEKALNVLLQIDKPLPMKITEITGITDADLLREGLTQEVAFEKFYQMYTKDTLLVAYNIQFDLGFMLAFFKRHLDKHFTFDNDILDVMAIYKDRHLFPHRLESAIETYRVLIPNSHRAIDDIRATHEVFRQMMRELNNVDKYINVIGFNPKYGVSGPKLPHVRYIGQYGGKREIEKA